MHAHRDSSKTIFEISQQPDIAVTSARYQKNRLDVDYNNTNSDIGGRQALDRELGIPTFLPLLQLNYFLDGILPRQDFHPHHLSVTH